MPDISTANSSTTPLGAGQTFVGQFDDVSNHAAVTVLVATSTPSAAAGLFLDWSADGEHIHNVQSLGPVVDSRVVHATTRAAFVRVRYVQGIFGNAEFLLQTLLRGTPPASNVGQAGDVVGFDEDAQIINAINFAQVGNNFMPVVASTNRELIVVPPPNRANVVRQVIPATVETSPQFDFFGLLLAERRYMTVHNNTTRGNLFLRFGEAATTTVWDFKVPPQHSWTMPRSWVTHGSTVFGIWDIADGDAHILEGV